MATAVWFKSNLRRTDKPRRSAISSARWTRNPLREQLSSSEPWRTSRVTRASPAITLVAPGFASMWPTVATRPGTLFAPAFDGNDPFRSGGDRVAAEMHRRGARMIGAADEHEARAGSGRRWLRRRQAAARALREPGLARCEIPGSRTYLPPLWLAESRRVQSKVFDGGANGNSLCIPAIEQLVIEPSNQRAAADERSAEADAFFLGKCRRFRLRTAAGRRSRASSKATARTTPRTPSYAPAFGTVSRCEPMSRRGAADCAAG